MDAKETLPSIDVKGVDNNMPERAQKGRAM